MFPFDLVACLTQIHWAWYVVAFVVGVVIHDLTQKDHAILRNFPFIGHGRYILEKFGPPFRQYFYKGDHEERPFDRATRTFVYSTSKGENDKIGFGTQVNYSDPGRIHILPSMFPIPEQELSKPFTPIVIGPKRRKPYLCTCRIGIGDMSFGALSAEAVSALAMGAARAGVHMCTGEGGLTPYHLSSGCKIFAEIGTAKFGYRTLDGQFDWDKVRKVAAEENVVAFHLKLAQGAKPGAGGNLPKEKITQEIADIRGIPLGVDCHSPNSWDEFHNVPEMFAFIKRLQDVTGKPVGIKIVGGDPLNLHEMAYRMKVTGEGPDYIIIDGGEGGTGAAPLMFADYVGLPIHHALQMLDNILRMWGVRGDVVVISSGKVATPADMFIHTAMGANLTHSSRPALFSIGCAQTQQCHTNFCITGIATQDPWLRHGFDVPRKSERCARFLTKMQEGFKAMMAAAGKRETWDLTRDCITQVVKPGVEKRISDLFPYPSGCNGNVTPVTAHNLDEYRAQNAIIARPEIPASRDLEAEVACILTQTCNSPTAVDDMDRLVKEAEMMTEKGDILTLPGAYEDTVPYIDLLGIARKAGNQKKQ